MKSKYPIVLVHGIALKDFKFFRCFGGIEKKLKKEGYAVYNAKVDGFGSIENNAEQLKDFVNGVLAESGAEKVNLVAHSKGGLDSKYMISKLGMENSVASLTTLCTPHKGSQVATKIYGLPNPLKKFIAFWVNLWYRIFGDKHPDALTVCRQLQSVKDVEEETFGFSGKVYCQSYSAVLKRSRDDFLMGIPLIFSRRWEKDGSDGLVSVGASKFGEYKGHVSEDSISHSEITGFSASKKKREKVYAFYLKLCEDLSELGF